MSRELQATVFSVILLIAPMMSVRQSGAQDLDSTHAKSNDNEGKFRAWLTSAGLARSFTIIRIGEGPHPDPRFALDGMIQHLELRFVTLGSDRPEETARFEKLLAHYQRDHASALSEKLLYEFVDAFALDPQLACVTLHVFDTIYYIYISRQDGSLVVSKGARAAYDAFSVTIPTSAPQEQFRTHFGQQSAPDPKAVRDAVEKFLRVYLGSIRSGAKPEIISEAHKQDGYLHLLVNGAKGMVTDGYWEWLDIAVFFHPSPTAGKDKGAQWDFVCNVEVKYASTPQETRPTDADLDYPKRVVDFRTKLGKQLQESLERGLHD